MKKSILLITLALTSVFCYAQNVPKIEFKAVENTIDYGTISKKDNNGIITIEFTNTGNAPLLINNVLSTPNFSIALKPTEAILPGKKGKIVLKHNMTSGPIRKTIIVESNAGNYEGGRIPLKIKGNVLGD